MFPNLKFELLKMTLKLLESRKPMIFRPMTQPFSWHTSGGEKKMVEAMALYLFRWWKTKVMETLTPKGYL